MRIGIDVGGTNTDAVLMTGDQVVAEVKKPTTPEVTDGIVAAMRTVMAAASASPADIDAVMIGTTHFTNAVVEARRLVPVAALRLGLPATRALPPLVDWPAALRSVVAGGVYLCHGGHEFDGREISTLDPAEITRVAEDIAAKGITAVAISSVFSPVNAGFEAAAAEILRAAVPGLAVSLSSEIGRLGLLERENAAIMNASLSGLAGRITGAFTAALAELELAASLYISQNDGTLMTVETAERYPVSTFASGPTNSMRGAALLSGEGECAVVDIGGTTSDIGILERGFPRQAKATVEVAGVRTNFRMPDVVSLGVGGGSRIRYDGGVSVGPDSVGYELLSEALVFGGATITASDIAVAAGRADFGDRRAVGHLDADLVARALERIDFAVSVGIDRMKTSAGDIPVVVVGGGSVLLDEKLAGASRLVRPDHFAVANAVGAAIAQVGGEVDQIFAIGEQLSRAEALERAKEEAAERAVVAGAKPDSVRIVDVDEVALAYIPGDAVRIRAKAVGDLDYGRRTIAAHW